MILYRRDKHNEINLNTPPKQNKLNLCSNLKIFCNGFRLGKKPSIKNIIDFKSGNITEIKIKLKVDIKLEKDTVIKKIINTIIKYTVFLNNTIGLDKIFEKIIPNCLAKLKNLFKSQSILHFTFDYLFFYLIK